MLRQSSPPLGSVVVAGSVVSSAGSAVGPRVSSQPPSSHVVGAGCAVLAVSPLSPRIAPTALTRMLRRITAAITLLSFLFRLIQLSFVGGCCQVMLGFSHARHRLLRFEARSVDDQAGGEHATFGHRANFRVRLGVCQ